MKVTELRIGNLVLATCPNTDTKEIYTIKEVFGDSVMLSIVSIFLPENSSLNMILDNYSEEYSIEEIEPIVLTEDILCKNGFRQSFATDPQEPNAMSLYYNASGDFSLTSTDDNRDVFSYETGIVVKDVHQLQNLYFALTGEELEILKSEKKDVSIDENTPVSMLEYNAAVSSLSERIEDLQKHIDMLQRENTRLKRKR